MGNESIARELGQRVRRIRMAKNMSQQALAEKISTTPQNISKYEKDGISNIDIIHEISQALGQNILDDEMDREGQVGEIGKEILKLLVNHQGFSLVKDIQSNMYGLSAERVTHEIFKLENIGLVVREQYKDLDDCEKDVLFITAKGIITYKNLNPFNASIDKNVTSYEERLGYSAYQHQLALNYQEIIDSRVMDKEIYKVGCKYYEDLDVPSFRRNYVQWLMQKYCQSITVGDYTDDRRMLTGQGFYYDLMFRMILGYDRHTYESMYDFTSETYGLSDEIDQLDTEIHMKEDHVVVNAKKRFSDEFDLPLEESEDPVKEDASEESIQKYHELVEELYREDAYYYNPKEILEERCAEFPDEPDPFKWFTTEDIKQFIEDNLTPSCDYENQLNDELAEITSKYPETREYYIFPEEWETNGLGQLVRDIYKLPSPDVADED